MFLIYLLSDTAYALCVNLSDTVLLYYRFYDDSLCIEGLNAFFIDYSIFKLTQLDSLHLNKLFHLFGLFLVVSGLGFSDDLGFDVFIVYVVFLIKV